LGTLIQPGHPRQRDDDEGHVAFGIGVRLLDPFGEDISGEAARLRVVGRQDRDESL